MIRNSTLVVIDAQTSFIQNPNTYIDKLVGFIKRWFNEDIVFTIFQNTSGSLFESELGFSRDYSENRLHPRIRNLAEKYRTFRKGTYDALKNTDFKNYILDGDFECAYIAGLETDACILSLSYSLFDLGIIPKVILPLCKTKSGSLQDSATEILERNIGKQNVLKEIPKFNGDFENEIH